VTQGDASNIPPPGVAQRVVLNGVEVVCVLQHESGRARMWMLRTPQGSIEIPDAILLTVRDAVGLAVRA
jgi:hypothetical protein